MMGAITVIVVGQWDKGFYDPNNHFQRIKEDDHGKEMAICH
jgi:hypothetical protein